MNLVKSEQGVEVKILYDDMGSRGLRKKAYARFLIGGHAEAFFPSKLPLINLRMNNQKPSKIICYRWANWICWWF